MTIALPPEKRQELHIRTTAIKYGWLYTRQLEGGKCKALSHHALNCKAKIQLSAVFLPDFMRWNTAIRVKKKKKKEKKNNFIQ